MVRRSRVFRLLLASLAAVQVSVPVMAALADAAYARDSEWVGVHIEEKRGPNDHWWHADDCIFCQFLAQHAVAARAQVDLRVARIASYDVITTPTIRYAGAGSLLPDSRAPPSA